MKILCIVVLGLALIGCCSSASLALNTQNCLATVKLTPQALSFLHRIDTSCQQKPSHSELDLCLFAEKQRDASPDRQAESQTRPARNITSDWVGRSAVFLNVYNLLKTNQVVQMLKCIYPNFSLKGVYHTSLTYRGLEYYFGREGIITRPDGETSFGRIRARQHLLGFEDFPSEEFQEFVEIVQRGNAFYANRYQLSTLNCNNFTNSFSCVMYERPIPDYIMRETNKVWDSPLGDAIWAAESFWNNWTGSDPPFCNRIRSSANISWSSSQQSFVFLFF